MAEKTWAEMDGWEKTWEITKIGGGFAMLLLAFVLGGKGAPTPRRSPTIWKPKFYRPTGVRKGWKY